MKPVEKICIVCGKPFLVTRQDRLDTAKYCSKECCGKVQKGKKNPHSVEWEEKRVSAVREAVKKIPSKKGMSRPHNHTAGMHSTLIKNRNANPEKYNQIARQNLSKDKSGDLRGANSPNWEGGITKECQRWRNKHRKHFETFNKIVLERDGYKCKECRSTENIHVHHIITVAECRTAAFIPMNGVSLCEKCHRLTDNYGGAAARLTKTIPGMTFCIARTIPQNYQAYDTVGNYQWTPDGILIIFVSKQKNPLYEKMIFIHEFIEATIALKNGVSEEDITKFDLWHEEEYKAGRTKVYEPGEHPLAPYRDQHFFAETLERLFCNKLGLDWNEYNNALDI